MAVNRLGPWLGEAAGLRVGDRVVSIAGRTPRGLADLAQPLRERRPGETLPVVVDRDGKLSAHEISLTRFDTATSPAIAVTKWLFTPWL